MSSGTSSYVTSSSSAFRRGPFVARGGEGEIYDVVGRPDLLLKLYHPDKVARRQEKVEAMVAAELHRRSSFVAFPLEAVYDGQRVFAGFTMRKVTDAREIHQLYSNEDRQEHFPRADYRFLVHTATNLAKAIASLHSLDCVIGDINESGILITDQATVVLIDSDSFQVLINGKVYPCEVGIDLYTPPELQGVRGGGKQRSENQDNFALALMIFRLLMLGRHPYTGRYLGRGEPPRGAQNIKELRYAYGAQAKQMNIAPPLNAMPISALPKGIVDAFEQAFGQQGIAARPTAAEWVRLLEALPAKLRQCGRSPYHQQYKQKCPLCDLEAKEGRPFFGPPPLGQSKKPAQPQFTQQPYTGVKRPIPTTPPQNPTQPPTPTRPPGLRYILVAIGIGAILAFVVFPWDTWFGTIANRAEIERLMSLAEKDFRTDRLMTADGNNALARYRAVLTLAPGHGKAERGIQRVYQRIRILENQKREKAAQQAKLRALEAKRQARLRALEAKRQARLRALEAKRQARARESEAKRRPPHRAAPHRAAPHRAAPRPPHRSAPQRARRIRESRTVTRVILTYNFHPFARRERIIIKLTDVSISGFWEREIIYFDRITNIEMYNVAGWTGIWHILIEARSSSGFGGFQRTVEFGKNRQNCEYFFAEFKRVLNSWRVKYADLQPNVRR